MEGEQKKHDGFPEERRGRLATHKMCFCWKAAWDDTFQAVSSAHMSWNEWWGWAGETCSPDFHLCATSPSAGSYSLLVQARQGLGGARSPS
jgi:hypothetical protein